MGHNILCELLVYGTRGPAAAAEPAKTREFRPKGGTREEGKLVIIPFF